MHIFRNREAFDLERADSFSGWLAVLARRRCLDLLRRRTPPPSSRELEEAEAVGWLASAPEQEAAVEDAELMEAVAAFKARLKPSWRSFFELHFVQGLDYKEVAERLSISKIRCKYMRRVLARRARRNPGIMAAVGRQICEGTGNAP